MRRSYDYHGSSRSSMDEYLERINQIQRMPSMIADTPYFPNVHEVINHKSPVYVDEKQSGKNPQKKNHQSSEFQKKVHFAEQDEMKRGAAKEKKVDSEADGYIQQKHRGFQLCKWDTFKAY